MRARGVSGEGEGFWGEHWYLLCTAISGGAASGDVLVVIVIVAAKVY